MGEKSENAQREAAEFIHMVAEKAVMTSAAYKMQAKRTGEKKDSEAVTDFFIGLVEEFAKVAREEPNEAAKMMLALVDVASTIAVNSLKATEADTDTTTGLTERG